MRHNKETDGPIQTDSRSEAAILAWLVDQLAQLLDIPPSDIDPAQHVSVYGVSSTEAIILTGDLGALTGCRFSDTLFFECPTIQAVAHYVADVARSEKQQQSLM